jgi:hypothetical protein
MFEMGDVNHHGGAVEFRSIKRASRDAPQTKHYAPSSTAVVLREELVLASSGVQMGSLAAGSK